MTKLIYVTSDTIRHKLLKRRTAPVACYPANSSKLHSLAKEMDKREVKINEQTCEITDTPCLSLQESKQIIDNFKINRTKKLYNKEEKNRHNVLKSSFHIYISRIFLFITVFTCFYNINGLAQESWFDDQVPHSPNISALGKFGDIPVGNYTGTPNIDIPIFLLKSGELEIPIKLKYHASGLKATEMSGWVGLGWALDAGGYIARRVRSVPDEGPWQGGAAEEINGYYQNYGPNMILENAPENWFVLDDVINRNYDVEPDLFLFCFKNYSGSFYFDQYRKPQLLPQQDLKIDVIYTEGTPGKFEQFIITTPEGNKYYFGGVGLNNVEAVEYTIPNVAANLYTQKHVSNWYLSKVETRDNTDEIFFEYERENYKFYNLSQFGQIIREGHCSGPMNPNNATSEDQIDGVRLSKITAANGIAEFIPDLITPRKDVHDGDSYVLQKISIKQSYNDEIQQDFVFFSHWEECEATQFEVGDSFNLNEDKWRLFLDKIQERTGTKQNLPYEFSYYQLPSSTDPTDIPKLPRRLTFDQDHWGYFNNTGNTIQNWLLPFLEFPTFNCAEINNWGGANREPQWPAMRAGTIKNIQYPTGGCTSFEFEAHEYYTHWTEPQIITTIPVSVGHGASSGTNISPSVDYTFPIADDGETLSVELFAQVTVESTSTNCAEVFLYDDNNNGALIEGTSFNCSEISYPSKTIPVHLVSDQTYKLRLVATNCMASLKVISNKLVSQGGNKKVGGLRIAKVINSPADNQPDIIKEYEYANGILFSTPVYFREVVDNMLPESALACSNGEKLYDISSGSVMPMLTSQGNHIGYSTVTVIQQGAGKHIFKYENSIPSSYLTLQFHKYPTAPPPYLFGNGNLIYEAYCNENNDTIREIDYDFELQQGRGTSVPAYNVVSVFIPPTCINPPLCGASCWNNGYDLSRWIEYTLTTGYSRLIKKTEINHCLNADISTVSTYEYSPNYISQVRSETQKRSDQEVVISFSKYPGDFFPAYEYTPSCYDQMQIDLHQCLQNYGDDRDQYLNCIQNLENKHRTCIENYNINYNLQLKAYETSSNEPLKSLYQMWNRNKISPIEQTTWMKENENAADSFLVSANYFDYRGFTNSISGIEDTKLHSIFSIPLVTPISNFRHSVIDQNLFLRDSRYEIEMSADYTKGRLSEVWKENDMHIIYYYGYNNSLLVAKFENMGNAAIESNTALKTYLDDLDDYTDLSSITDRTNLKILNINIRFQIPDSCMITTYTYKPLIGMTSQTDPNGKTTYYQYDDFGRLEMAKDDDGNIVKKYNYHYKN